MKQTIKCLVAAFAAMLMSVAAFAQVTTSSLNGHVADEAGEPLAGAAIIAVHTPSGTQYATVANDQGKTSRRAAHPKFPCKPWGLRQ